VTVRPDHLSETLEGYRAYLECLTAIQIDPRLRLDPRVRARFGWSDVINATLLDACRDLNRLDGMPAEDRQRWLRTLLANNLVDRMRKELAKRRNFRLERSLDAAVEESSCRLQDWCAAEETTPGERLMRQERALLVAQALARLPESQREALILQQWHGWTLARIAERMQRTVGAVAGLIRSGLQELKELLGGEGASHDA
jgi:RNA polymerase sigma-70 factor (ECF subfamily)